MELHDRPPEGDSPKRSKLEDEVLEILHKADRPPSVTAQVRSRAREGRMALGRMTERRRRFDPRGPLMPLLGALGVAILGALVHGASPLLATLLGFVSFGLFCSLWFAPSTGPGTGNRWRGRNLDDLPGRPPTPLRRPGWPRR